MEFSDYFVNLVLSGILIVGAYQFYFGAVLDKQSC